MVMSSSDDPHQLFDFQMKKLITSVDIDVIAHDWSNRCFKTK